MDEQQLSDKVAIVTGGASGIGAATSRLFVERGARVLIADMDGGAGEALAAELGDAAAFLRVNVAREEDVAAMVAEATDRFDRLDVVFNNAGFGGALGPIVETTVDDFDLTFDVLLKGVFLGIKHAVPALIDAGGGSIINTASVAGLRPGWAPHLYSTAKSAVISLTESVAMEVAEHDIRCNAVCPGFIATPLAAGRPDASDAQIEQLRQSAAEFQPLGRVGEPHEIGEMVAFLASDRASWITGQQFVVDGGVSTGRLWKDMPEMFRVHRPIRHHRPEGR